MPSFPRAPTSPVTASACPWTPATRGHCCVEQSCARIRCRKVGYSPALRPARAAHSPHHPHGCPCRVQLTPAVGGAEGVTARSPSSPPRLGQPDWAAFATRKDEGRTRSSQLGSVWPPSVAVPRGPLTSSVQGRCPSTDFWSQVTYDPRPTLLGLPVLRDRPPHGPCGLSPAKNTSRKSGGPDAHVWGPPPSGHRRSPWKRTLKALSLL